MTFRNDIAIVFTTYDQIRCVVRRNELGFKKSHPHALHSRLDPRRIPLPWLRLGSSVRETFEFADLVFPGFMVGVGQAGDGILSF